MTGSERARLIHSKVFQQTAQIIGNGEKGYWRITSGLFGGLAARPGSDIAFHIDHTFRSLNATSVGWVSSPARRPIEPALLLVSLPGRAANPPNNPEVIRQ